MKRFLSMIMVVAMLITSIPNSIFAFDNASDAVNAVSQKQSTAPLVADSAAGEDITSEGGEVHSHSDAVLPITDDTAITDISKNITVVPSADSKPVVSLESTRPDLEVIETIPLDKTQDNLADNEDKTSRPNVHRGPSENQLRADRYLEKELEELNGDIEVFEAQSPDAEGSFDVSENTYTDSEIEISASESLDENDSVDENTNDTEVSDDISINSDSAEESVSSDAYMDYAASSDGDGQSYISADTQIADSDVAVLPSDDISVEPMGYYAGVSGTINLPYGISARAGDLVRVYLYDANIVEDGKIVYTSMDSKYSKDYILTEGQTAFLYNFSNVADGNYMLAVRYMSGRSGISGAMMFYSAQRMYENEYLADTIVVTGGYTDSTYDMYLLSTETFISGTINLENFVISEKQIITVQASHNNERDESSYTTYVEVNPGDTSAYFEIGVDIGEYAIRVSSGFFPTGYYTTGTLSNSYNDITFYTAGVLGLSDIYITPKEYNQGGSDGDDTNGTLYNVRVEFAKAEDKERTYFVALCNANGYVEDGSWEYTAVGDKFIEATLTSYLDSSEDLYVYYSDITGCDSVSWDGTSTSRFYSANLGITNDITEATNISGNTNITIAESTYIEVRGAITVTGTDISGVRNYVYVGAEIADEVYYTVAYIPDASYSIRIPYRFIGSEAQLFTAGERYAQIDEKTKVYNSSSALLNSTMVYADVTVGSYTEISGSVVLPSIAPSNGGIADITYTAYDEYGDRTEMNLGSFVIYPSTTQTPYTVAIPQNSQDFSIRSNLRFYEEQCFVPSSSVTEELNSTDIIFEQGVRIYGSLSLPSGVTLERDVTFEVNAYGYDSYGYDYVTIPAGEKAGAYSINVMDGDILTELHARLMPRNISEISTDTYYLGDYQFGSEWQPIDEVINGNTNIDITIVVTDTISGTISFAPDCTIEETVNGYICATNLDNNNTMSKWLEVSGTQNIPFKITVPRSSNGYKVYFYIDRYTGDTSGVSVEKQYYSQTGTTLNENLASVVSVNGLTQNIDIEVSAPTLISGKLDIPADFASIDGLREVEVCLYTPGSTYYDKSYRATVDSEFNFKANIPSVLSGEYKIAVVIYGGSNTNLIAKEYVYNDGTPVTFTAGMGVSGIDVALETGYAVSGTVSLPDDAVTEDCNIYFEVEARLVQSNTEYEIPGTSGMSFYDDKTSLDYMFAIPKDFPGDFNLAVSVNVNSYGQDISNVISSTYYFTQDGSVTLDKNAAASYTAGNLSGKNMTLQTGEIVEVTINAPERTDENDGASYNGYIYIYDRNNVQYGEKYYNVETYNTYADTVYFVVPQNVLNDGIYVEYFSYYSDFVYSNGNVYVSADGTYSKFMADATPFVLSSANKSISFDMAKNADLETPLKINLSFAEGTKSTSKIRGRIELYKQEYGYYSYVSESSFEVDGIGNHTISTTIPDDNAIYKVAVLINDSYWGEYLSAKTNVLYYYSPNGATDNMDDAGEINYGMLANGNGVDIEIPKERLITGDIKIHGTFISLTPFERLMMNIQGSNYTAIVTNTNGTYSYETIVPRSIYNYGYNYDISFSPLASHQSNLFSNLYGNGSIYIPESGDINYNIELSAAKYISGTVTLPEDADLDDDKITVIYGFADADSFNSSGMQYAVLWERELRNLSLENPSVQFMTGFPQDNYEYVMFVNAYSGNATTAANSSSTIPSMRFFYSDNGLTTSVKDAKRFSGNKTETNVNINIPNGVKVRTIVTDAANSNFEGDVFVELIDENGYVYTNAYAGHDRYSTISYLTSDVLAKGIYVRYSYNSYGATTNGLYTSNGYVYVSPDGSYSTNILDATPYMLNEGDGITFRLAKQTEIDPTVIKGIVDLTDGVIIKQLDDEAIDGELVVTLYENNIFVQEKRFRLTEIKDYIFEFEGLNLINDYTISATLYLYGATIANIPTNTGFFYTDRGMSDNMYNAKSIRSDSGEIIKLSFPKMKKISGKLILPSNYIGTEELKYVEANVYLYNNGLTYNQIASVDNELNYEFFVPVDRESYGEVSIVVPSESQNNLVKNYANMYSGQPYFEPNGKDIENLDVNLRAGYAISGKIVLPEGGTGYDYKEKAYEVTVLELVENADTINPGMGGGSSGGGSFGSGSSGGGFGGGFMPDDPAATVYPVAVTSTIVEFKEGQKEADFVLGVADKGKYAIVVMPYVSPFESVDTQTKSSLYNDKMFYVNSTSVAYDFEQASLFDVNANISGIKVSVPFGLKVDVELDMPESIGTYTDVDVELCARVVADNVPSGTYQYVVVRTGETTKATYIFPEIYLGYDLEVSYRLRFDTTDESGELYNLNVYLNPDGTYTGSRLESKYFKLEKVNNIGITLVTKQDIGAANAIYATEHPYGDNVELEYTYVHNDPDVDYLAVTFSPETELGSGDAIIIYDQTGMREIGYYTYYQLAGSTINIPGNKFSIRFTSDYGTPAYGYDIVSIVGKNYELSSEHPYENNIEKTYFFKYDGEETATAQRFKAVFSESTMLGEGDYIVIFDGNDNYVGTYYNDDLSGAMIKMNTPSFKLMLISNEAKNGYGFDLDSFEPVKYYKVTFNSYDGTLLYETEVEEGTDAYYNGSYIPEKPMDDDYMYDFIGWGGDVVSNITQDTVLTAQYEAVKYYTVKFYVDNKYYHADFVRQGEKAYADIPNKQPDEYIYTFVGWDTDISSITSDLEVNALFDKAEYFTVTYKNYDGSVITAIPYAKGTTPVYTGYTPTRPLEGTNRTKYKFTGWDKDLTAITGDEEVTALYEIEIYMQSEHSYSNSIEEIYTYSHPDGDAEMLDITFSSNTRFDYYSDYLYVYSGTDTTGSYLNRYTYYQLSGVTISVPGNTFSLKLKTNSYSTAYGFEVTNIKKVTSGTYTVTFLDYKGDAVQQTQVKGLYDAEYTGPIPTKPSDDETDYIFIGWDKSLEAINEDTVFTPVFEAVTIYMESPHPYNTYTTYNYSYTHPGECEALSVTFSNLTEIAPENDKIYIYDGNGELAGTYHGTELKGKTVKVLGNSFRIRFSTSYRYEDYYGFSVIGIETAEVEVCTVKFVNYDGTLLKETKVIKGGSVTYTDDEPVKETEDDFVYEFIGWDKNTNIITEDITFTAQYIEHPAHIITFVDDKGEFVYSAKVSHGSTVYPYEILPNDKWEYEKRDENYVYQFERWEGNMDNVTEDRTVKAVYQKYTYHTVVFKDYDGSVLYTAYATVNQYSGSDRVDYMGPVPYRPYEGETGYVFAGWDKSTDNIYEDMELYPVFDKCSVKHIYNEDDLFAMADDPEAVYVLENDITLTREWQSIGIMEQNTNGTYGEFCGVFDGKNHTISNVVITETSGSTGFFDYLSDAVVKNLKLNINYMANTDNSATAGLYMVLSGFARNVYGSIISNVHVSGSINADGYEISGFASNIGRSVVSESSANVDLISGGDVAGFAIRIESATVKNSYYSGNITTGKNKSGLYGFAGFVSSKENSRQDVGNGVINCYSNASVTLTDGVTADDLYKVSPFVSLDIYEKDAPISNVYYNKDKFTLPALGYYNSNSDERDEIVTFGTPLSDVQMKNANSFTGFDFANVWSINAGINGGYPYNQKLSSGACGHSFSGWTVVTAASCTSKGQQKRTCYMCGYTQYAVIEATGHTYSASATIDSNPTCTTPGSQSVKCTLCGHKINATVIDALGHNFSEWIVSVQATCDKNGKKMRTCQREGCSHVEYGTIFAPGHSYGEWNITSEVSCETNGVKSRECTVCHNVDEKFIPAWTHEYGAEEYVAPTCTTDGKYYIACIRDGCDSEIVNQVIPALGHDYGNWYIEREPTAMVQGIRACICSTCGDIQREFFGVIEDISPDDKNYGYVTFTVVNAQTKAPIEKANIFVSTETKGEIILSTASNGKVSRYMPVGTHTVSVYADSYIARNFKLNIKHGEQLVPDIGLSDRSPIRGELTSDVMTKDEILDAGIDVDDPDNAHVVKYSVNFEFNAGVDLLSLTTYYNGGEFIGFGDIPEKEGYTLHYHIGDRWNGHSWCKIVDTELNAVEKLNYTPYRSGNFTFDGWYLDPEFTQPATEVTIDRETVYVYGRWIGEPVEEHPFIRTEIDDKPVTIYPVSDKFYMVVYGEVKWLKEMFDIELLIMNDSATDSITNGVAELILPDGLSLATMDSNTLAQSTVKNVPDIAENGSQSVHWYLRGDKEGSYDLSATFDGIMMPFEEPISHRFETSKPLQVYAGSALEMNVTLPESTVYNEDYTISFELKNVSDRTLYNVKHAITGFKQAAVTIYSDGSEEKEIYTESNEPVYVGADEFKPGDSLVIDITTNVMFDSKVMEYHLSKFADDVTTMMKAYNVFKNGAEVINSTAKFLNEFGIALDNLLASQNLASDKIISVTDLRDLIAGVSETIYADQSDKALMIADMLCSSGIKDKLQNLDAATATADAINGISKDTAAIVNSSLARTSNGYNAFESFRTMIESIPVRYYLDNILVSTLEGSTTEIDFNFHTTPAKPSYFGVESVSKYIWNNTIAAVGQLSDPWYCQILGTDRIAEAEAYVKTVEGEIAKFAAKDASGNTTFKVRVESADPGTGITPASVSDAFEISTDNETASYDALTGTLTFTGAGYIDVKSLGSQGGVLVVEMTNGTETKTQNITLDVASAHECTSAQWISLIDPTDSSKGTRVKYCATCGDILGFEEYTACANHTYGDYVVDSEPTEDTDGLKYRVCSACGHTQYVITSLSPLTELEPSAESTITVEPSQDGDDVTYLQNVPEEINAEQLKSNFNNESGSVAVLDENGAEIAEDVKVGTGCTVQLKDSSGGVIHETVVVIKGDINGNGEVNILDLVKLFNAANETTQLDGAYKEAALIDDNRDINLFDLVKLFKKVQN